MHQLAFRHLTTEKKASWPWDIPTLLICCLGRDSMQAASSAAQDVWVKGYLASAYFLFNVFSSLKRKMLRSSLKHKVHSSNTHIHGGNKTSLHWKPIAQLSLEGRKGGPFLTPFKTAALKEVPLLVCNIALLRDGRSRFQTPWVCGVGEGGKNFNQRSFPRVYKLLWSDEWNPCF